MPPLQRPLGRYIVIAIVSVIVLYPFVAMLSFSLRTNADLLTDPNRPHPITFDNYVDMWS